MIVGVALVVDELHKGQRLVFRYPESVPSAALNSTTADGESLLRFHKEYLSLSPENFARLFRPKSSLSNEVLELFVDDLHYVCFPCSCADEGEVKGVNESNQPTASASSSSSSSSSSSTAVSGAEGAGQSVRITFFNLVVAQVRQSSMDRVKGKVYERDIPTGQDPVAAILGLHDEHFFQPLPSSSLRLAVERFSKALQHEERRARYVSRQVSLMLGIAAGGGAAPDGGSGGGVGNGGGGSGAEASSGPALSPTPIVLSTASHSSSMPSNPSPWATSDSAAADGGTDSPGPLSPQPSSLPPADSDQPQSQSQSGSLALSDSGPQPLSSLPPGWTAPHTPLSEEILQRSSLANELRALYHGLAGGHHVAVAVNACIDVNVSLRRPPPPPSSSSSSPPSAADAGAESNAKVKVSAKSAVSPDDALLTVCDAEEMKILLGECAAPAPSAAGLGYGADWDDRRAPTSSAQLLAALPLLVPTSSLRDVARALEMTVGEVVELARHLVSWGLASPLQPLTEESVLQVHQQAPCTATSKVALAFAAAFLGGLNPSSSSTAAGVGVGGDPRLTLPSGVAVPVPTVSMPLVMSLFDGHRPLGAALARLPRALLPHGLDMAVWLLRRRILVLSPSASASASSSVHPANQ